MHFPKTFSPSNTIKNAFMFRLRIVPQGVILFSLFFYRLKGSFLFSNSVSKSKAEKNSKENYWLDSWIECNWFNFCILNSFLPFTVNLLFQQICHVDVPKCAKWSLLKLKQRSELLLKRPRELAFDLIACCLHIQPSQLPKPLSCHLSSFKGFSNFELILKFLIMPPLISSPGPKNLIS